MTITRPAIHRTLVACCLAISACVASAAEGAWATYHANPKLADGPLVERIDPTIAFEWGGGAPAATLPADGFSVLWSAWLTAPVSGRYTLLTTSDDGVRLALGGRTVINNWTDHARTTDRTEIDLVAGAPVELMMSYYENGGQAVALLEWEGPGITRTVIPAQALSPRPLPVPLIGRGNGLAAAYFPGEAFAGTPLRRIDPQVNFTWVAAPAPGLPADRFSVRWQGKVVPMLDGQTTLIITADDGARVWLNGQQIVDDWTDHGAREYRYTFAAQAGIPQDLRIDYYDYIYGAVAKLEWESASLMRQAIPSSQLLPAATMTLPTPATGSGLSAAYFANRDLSGRPVLRRDRTVDFRWGGSAPMAGIPADSFSVRWSGRIQPRYDEDYTLIVTSDDGVRVWLDGALVVDRWTLHGATEDRFTFAAQAGRKYAIRMEFFENQGDAVARLEWQSRSESRIPVPACALYPNAVEAYIPTSSAVSPAFIEGLHDEKLSVTPSAGRLSAFGGSRFGIDLPLSPSATSPLAITAGDTTCSGAVGWTVTLLSGQTRFVLRPGDALLLQAPADGNVTTYLGCGVGATSASFAITAGERRPLTFPVAGSYRVEQRKADGTLLGELLVEVPGCTLQPMVACETQYRRSVVATLAAPGDAGLLSFTAADEWIEVGAATTTDLRCEFPLCPRRNIDTALLVRVGSATGPVLTAPVVRPFELESDSGKIMRCLEVRPDGTFLCEGSLLMRRLVPGLDVALHAFVAGVTFEDSSIDLTVGSADFVTDASGNGRLVYRLLRAPGIYTGVCHSWTVFQGGVRVSP